MIIVSDNNYELHPVYSKIIPGGINKILYYYFDGHRKAVRRGGGESRARIKGEAARIVPGISGFYVYKDGKNFYYATSTSTEKLRSFNEVSIYTPSQVQNIGILGISREAVYLISMSRNPSKIRRFKIDFEGYDVKDAYAFYNKNMMSLVVLRRNKIELYNYISSLTRPVEIELDLPFEPKGLLRSITDRYLGVYGRYLNVDVAAIIDVEKEKGFIIKMERAKIEEKEAEFVTLIL